MPFSPLPRYSGGEGSGVRGLRRARLLGLGLFPPHPQPLSPGVPGERGEGRQRTVRTLYSASLYSVIGAISKFFAIL